MRKGRRRGSWRWEHPRDDETNQQYAEKPKCSTNLEDCSQAFRIAKVDDLRETEYCFRSSVCVDRGGVDVDESGEHECVVSLDDERS